ncbi:unnamed protein product [Bursaphelenchus xylophilus]|uniref:(pine wood nematode) hypothetical protein n=1 Tax=Bursaphelenchus xylophilus TaxID=6326 RepID=A0A811L9N8_BURXY|nr:unnamed protein product [Bursaphelenchus xylophilus]CAG9113774.1 unnamed protein product [Bursaphelenchus xylophilus]
MGSNEEPFEREFGWERLLPTLLHIPENCHRVFAGDKATYAQQLARQTEQAWRRDVEALEDESAMMKQQFDHRKQVQQAHVTVGDLVLRRVDAYRKGEYHKFQAPMLSFSMQSGEPKSGYI